jgi:plastocyanin
MKQNTLLIFVLLLASTMIGCIGGDDDDTSSETTDDDADETPQSNAVDITGFAFSPETLTISIGDTVAWTNKESATHTATADGGEFDSGNLGNGDTFSHTFTAAGTYTYYCKIHTSMTATIIVE